MKDYRKIAGKQLSERFRNVSYCHFDGELKAIAASAEDGVCGETAQKLLGEAAAEKLLALSKSGERAIFDVEADSGPMTVLAFRHNNILGCDVIYRCYFIKKDENYTAALADACQLESELSCLSLMDGLGLPAAAAENGRISYCNEAFAAITGYPLSVLYSMSLSNLVSRGDKAAVQEMEKGSLSQSPARLTINAAAGSCTADLWAGSNGEKILAMFTDFEQSKYNERLGELFREATAAVDEAICLFDGAKGCLAANQRFYNLFGESADFFTAVCPTENKAEFLAELEENHGKHYVSKLSCAGGAELYCQINIRGLSNGLYCAAVKDMTESLDKERLLGDYKTVDYPTGVINSACFRDRLTKEVEKARFSGETLNLVMFSMVNYSDFFFAEGSVTADTLLKTTAQRAKGFLPEGCQLGRLGESRFGIYFTAPKKEALEFVQDFMSYMDASTVDNGNTYYSKIYAGLCSYPEDADCVQDLYSNAKNVLRNACAASTSPAYGCFGEDGVMETCRYKSTFEYTIEQAAKNDDFRMEYQPIADLTTGETVMLAALLRTKSPILRDGVSKEFLMAAEYTGAIVPIGYKTLEEVAKYQKQRTEKGLKFLPVTFNLSLCQLMDSGLVEFCEELFEKLALPRNAVLFRISAHELRWHRKQCINVVNELSQKGFSLSISRFNGRDGAADLPKKAVAAYTLGTGISSEAVSAAHSAGMKIIAVGVETEAQRLAVKSAGFDYCQGFVYGKSADKDELDV